MESSGGSPGSGSGQGPRILHILFYVLYVVVLLRVLVGIPDAWAESLPEKGLRWLVWPLHTPLRLLLPDRMEDVMERVLPSVMGLVLLVFLHVLAAGLARWRGERGLRRLQDSGK
jgi:hypothetical protein